MRIIASELYVGQWLPDSEALSAASRRSKMASHFFPFSVLLTPFFRRSVTRPRQVGDHLRPVGQNSARRGIVGFFAVLKGFRRHNTSGELVCAHVASAMVGANQKHVVRPPNT